MLIIYNILGYRFRSTCPSSGPLEAQCSSNEMCALPSELKLQLYVGHLESKERLRIQPAQLFNFS